MNFQLPPPAPQDALQRYLSMRPQWQTNQEQLLGKLSKLRPIGAPTLGLPRLLNGKMRMGDTGAF